jgi:hypothetical protein
MDPNAVLKLYGLPPEQFTATRNQLATALKDAGDLAASAEVKHCANRQSLPGWPTGWFGSHPTRSMS